MSFTDKSFVDDEFSSYVTCSDNRLFCSHQEIYREKNVFFIFMLAKNYSSHYNTTYIDKLLLKLHHSENRIIDFIRSGIKNNHKTDKEALI